MCINIILLQDSAPKGAKKMENEVNIVHYSRTSFIKLKSLQDIFNTF
jgi:hypothetical protein